jgi:hypothetical protein
MMWSTTTTTCVLSIYAAVIGNPAVR